MRNFTNSILSTSGRLLGKQRYRCNLMRYSIRSSAFKHYGGHLGLVSTNTHVAQFSSQRTRKQHVDHVEAASSKYKMLTQREQILHRPGMYIGEVSNVTRSTRIYDDSTGSIENRTITYNPGLVKLFDEILVNAFDNFQGDTTTEERIILIDVKPGVEGPQSAPIFQVVNNGRSLPVIKHNVTGLYIPDMVFGHLNTGSNYDRTGDSPKTGGTHGLGAKLVNIFSTTFEIDIREKGETGSLTRFSKRWMNNMGDSMLLNRSDDAPSPLNIESDTYTSIRWTPDLRAFRNKIDDLHAAAAASATVDPVSALSSVDSEEEVLSSDTMSLLKRRAVDIAALLGPRATVVFNGVKIDFVKSLADYAYFNGAGGASSRLMLAPEVAFSLSSLPPPVYTPVHSELISKNIFSSLQKENSVDSADHDSVASPRPRPLFGEETVASESSLKKGKSKRASSHTRTAPLFSTNVSNFPQLVLPLLSRGSGGGSSAEASAPLTLEESAYLLASREVLDVPNCFTVVVSPANLALPKTSSSAAVPADAAEPKKSKGKEKKSSVRKEETETPSSETVDSSKVSESFSVEQTSFLTPAAVSRANESGCFSFVNGISTDEGGAHVDVLMKELVAHMLPSMQSLIRQGYFVSPLDEPSFVQPDFLNLAAEEVTPALLRSVMRVHIDARLSAPTFRTQTKEHLSNSRESILAQLSNCMGNGIAGASAFQRELKQFASRLSEGSVVGVAAAAVALAAARARYRRMFRAGTQKVSAIPKLEDANWAGGPRAHECALILTEGDSAKALAVAGLGALGRDRFGVFPLRGKLRNAMDLPLSKIASMPSLMTILTILGVQPELQGSGGAAEAERRRKLRYGKVIIMTDQDHDGAHIKGLLIAFFQAVAPGLVANGVRPGEPFLEQFITPLVKARLHGLERCFYDNDSFERWREGDSVLVPRRLAQKQKETNAAAKKKKQAKGSSPSPLVENEESEEFSAEGLSEESIAQLRERFELTPPGESRLRGWSIKYYKGLGTSTAAEAREYFSDLGLHVRPFIYSGMDDLEAIRLAFGGNSDSRKDMLCRVAAERYAEALATVQRRIERISASAAVSSGNTNTNALSAALDTTLQLETRPARLEKANLSTPPNTPAAGSNISQDPLIEAALRSSTSSLLSTRGVTYRQFTDSELADYSLYSVKRAIPGLLDGFKVSHRKIMFTAFGERSGVSLSHIVDSLAKRKETPSSSDLPGSPMAPTEPQRTISDVSVTSVEDNVSLTSTSAKRSTSSKRRSDALKQEGGQHPLQQQRESLVSAFVSPAATGEVLGERSDLKDNLGSRLLNSVLAAATPTAPEHLLQLLEGLSAIESPQELYVWPPFVDQRTIESREIPIRSLVGLEPSSPEETGKKHVSGADEAWMVDVPGSPLFQPKLGPRSSPASQLDGYGGLADSLVDQDGNFSCLRARDVSPLVNAARAAAAAILSARLTATSSPAVPLPGKMKRASASSVENVADIGVLKKEAVPNVSPQPFMTPSVPTELIFFGECNNFNNSLDSTVQEGTDLELSPALLSLASLLVPSVSGTETKVVQFAGDVMARTRYHHGDAALNAAIIGLAQSYPGSNNVPLLYPSGQFGTRLQGGQDSAAPRYLHTRGSRLARLFFPAIDDDLLKRVTEDDTQAEPVSYLPVVPFLFVNGAVGIATAWSTTTPSFSPLDLADATAAAVKRNWETSVAMKLLDSHLSKGPNAEGRKRSDLHGRSREIPDSNVEVGRASENNAFVAAPFQLIPWIRGFRGAVLFDGHYLTTTGRIQVLGFSSTLNQSNFASKFKTRSTTKSGGLVVRITELPLGLWIDDYMEFLQQLESSGAVTNILRFGNEKKVEVFVTLSDSYLFDNCEEFRGSVPPGYVTLSKRQDSETRYTDSKGTEPIFAIKLWTIASSLNLISTKLHRNMNAISVTGAVQQLGSPWDAVAMLLPPRLALYQARKLKLKALSARQVLILSNRAEFSKLIASGKLALSRLSTQEVIAELRKLGFTPLGSSGLRNIHLSEDEISDWRSMNDPVSHLRGGSISAASLSVLKFLPKLLMELKPWAEFIDLEQVAEYAADVLLFKDYMNQKNSGGVLSAKSYTASLKPHSSDFDYLLNQPMHSLTKNSAVDITIQLEKTQTLLTLLDQTSAKQMWLADLHVLKSALPSLLESIDSDNILI